MTMRTKRMPLYRGFFHISSINNNVQKAADYGPKNKNQKG